MLLRQCCYSTGYPKSAPSTTSSQQTSLGPRAPRTTTEHWDFLYHINHTLEVERIVGQVTLLVHFHLRFLSYYPLLIQFFIKLPSSQTSTFLAAGFRTLSSLLVVFDSWKSKLQHQKTSKLPPGSLSGLVTITDVSSITSHPGRTWQYIGWFPKTELWILLTRNVQHYEMKDFTFWDINLIVLSQMKAANS